MSFVARSRSFSAQAVAQGTPVQSPATAPRQRASPDSCLQFGFAGGGDGEDAGTLLLRFFDLFGGAQLLQ